MSKETKTTKSKFSFELVAARGLGAGAGGAAGAWINGVLPESLNPQVRGGILVGVGAVLPEVIRSFAPKAKPVVQTLADSFGSGIAAMGGVIIANSFIDDPAKKLQVAGTSTEDLPTIQGDEYIVPTYVDSTPSVTGHYMDEVDGMDDDYEVNGSDDEINSEVASAI